MFTNPYKQAREIRKFLVADLQRRLRNVQKSVMHVRITVLCASLRFRCHRKRIDRFASTLPFTCAFDCLHQYDTCVRFRFDPLSRTFSNRCVFGENAECISVDGRAKRIKMYAFSNENALVWTSLVACVACVVTGYEHLNLDGAFRSVFY